MEKLTNREIDLLDRALDTKAVYTEDYTWEEISEIGRKLKGYRTKQYRMKTVSEMIKDPTLKFYKDRFINTLNDHYMIVEDVIQHEIDNSKRYGETYLTKCFYVEVTE